MSIKKSNIKILAAVMTAVFCLQSCLDLDEGRNDGVGYMELQGLAADVEVYELVPTRSGTVTLSELGVTEYNEPEIGKITFTLTGPMNHSWKGALTEALALTVGEYTLTGTYDNSGNDGLGEALYGEFSTSFDVSAQQTVTPVIKLPLVNSLVKVTMASGFAQHFEPEDGACVTFTVGESSESAAVGNYVFVPASSALNVKVSGTNSAGVEKTLSYDLTSHEAKTAYNIVCGMTTEDIPVVTLAQDLSAGAFEDLLYFPEAAVSNINTDVAAGGSELVYEIIGGSYTDWKKVTVADVEGKTYKHISGLETGKEYRLRARVGNIYSNGDPDGVPFKTVAFASCVTLGEVSAKHNNEGNPSLELSHTTMTSSGMKTTLPAIIDELTDVTVTGSFNSGKADNATGSFQANLSSTASQVSFTNAEGWPYIPQGTYATEVKATCTLNGKTYETASKGNITVPAPEFGVVFKNAYTSYDKYSGSNSIAKNITDANNCDPDMLKGSGVTCSISNTLMSNPKYSKSFKVHKEDGTVIGTIKSDIAIKDFTHDIDGLSWASYKVANSFTFDGVTKTSEYKTHHITGLPYRAAPPKKSGVHAWTVEGGGIWDGTDEYAKLSNGGGGCTMTSIDFYIPQNINVKVGAKYDVVGKAIGTTFTLKLGTTTVYSTKVSSYKTESVNSSVDSEMTSSNNKIVCNNSYGLGSTHSKVYQISLEYR